MKRKYSKLYLEDYLNHTEFLVIHPDNRVEFLLPYSFEWAYIQYNKDLDLNEIIKNFAK